MEPHHELDLERLRNACQGESIGHTIDYHRSIVSTMPRAHELASDPAIRSGTIVFAEEQTGGKGRRGRSWSAPYASSLLFGVIIKPPRLPSSSSTIPMAAGIAVVEAVRSVAPTLRDFFSLKWPNDVLIFMENGPAKIGGILSKMVYEGSQPQFAVIGIGLNVNQTLGELPKVESRMVQPASLRLALGEPVDRTELLIQLCKLLGSYLAPESQADLFHMWRAELSTLRQEVDVYLSPDDDTTIMTGCAEDVAPNGDLLVRDGEGRLHAFSAGDVSVRSSSRNA